VGKDLAEDTQELLGEDDSDVIIGKRMTLWQGICILLVHGG
jgi:hypothetical protein